MSYPPGHYLPHGAPYYPSDTGSINANSSGVGYRERYPSGGSNSGDWREYRRDYDRRAQPPSGTS